MSREWLSSAEASRRLGVSSATLYAYVSRGLLRSEGAAGQREKRYSADDVTRLNRRRDVGAGGPVPVASAGRGRGGPADRARGSQRNVRGGRAIPAPADRGGDGRAGLSPARPRAARRRVARARRTRAADPRSARPVGRP